MGPISRSFRGVALGFLAFAAVASVGDGAYAGKPKPAPKRDLKAEKKACVEAHARGQTLMREGKLAAAREDFITCGLDTCPGAIRKECADLLAKVNEKQPSVVIDGRDEVGRPTTEVKVFVDDKEMAASLDGRAIEVDPGQRTFRYVLKGGKKTLERKVLVLEGQRSRKLSVVFGQPPPPPPKPFEVPLLSYILGGVAIGGLGNFAVWGALGKSKQGDLEDSCAPRCRQEDVDAMRSNYVLADVSLALGAAALGAAVVVTLVHNSGEEKPAPPVNVVLHPGGFMAVGHF